MNILINASNLKQGGGIQVANSICGFLKDFPRHRFIVVLSSYFKSTNSVISAYDNVNVIVYNVKNNLKTLLFGRDTFLDKTVQSEKINVVLTIFGPSRWNPRCLHFSGFALSFLVIPDSPYYQRMNKIELMKAKFRNMMWGYYFKRSTKYFYTENPYITERLEKKFKGSKVYTVTNFYNQIFDQSENWKVKMLPKFRGITMLTIANSYPHKNLELSIGIAKWLLSNYPDFVFRFVFTIDEKKFPILEEDIRRYFIFLGSVDISECPSLYQQCDIAFQPSLLECFTATYPEAMRMEKPIVTVDLLFARSLCGNAAIYYNALSVEDAAKKIYEVSTNKILQIRMIEEGKKRLKMYDTYNERATKLINICEQLFSEQRNDK